VLLESPVPITELTTSVPDDLVAIVNRCIARDPNERYQNGNALLSALGD
jgi:serine/threonine protein kinase